MRTIEQEAEIIYGKRKKRIGKRIAEKERDHDLTGQDEENFNED